MADKRAWYLTNDDKLHFRDEKLKPNEWYEVDRDNMDIAGLDEEGKFRVAVSDKSKIRIVKVKYDHEGRPVDRMRYDDELPTD